MQQYSPIFKVEEIASQRDWVTCLTRCSQWVRELEFGTVSFCLQNSSSFQSDMLGLGVLSTLKSTPLLPIAHWGLLIQLHKYWWEAPVCQTQGEARPP